MSQIRWREALKATGLTEARVHQKPRLLSDNGPCYISKELREWLQDRDMEHTRGAPYHPMTQGKIERYHPIHEEAWSSWSIITSPGNWRVPSRSGWRITTMSGITSHWIMCHRADVYEGRRNDILDRRSMIKSRTLTARGKCKTCD